MVHDPVYFAQVYNIWNAYLHGVDVNDPKLQIQPYVKAGVEIIRVNEISSVDELAALLSPSDLYTLSLQH